MGRVPVTGGPWRTPPEETVDLYPGLVVPVPPAWWEYPDLAERVRTSGDDERITEAFGAARSERFDRHR